MRDGGGEVRRREVVTTVEMENKSNEGEGNYEVEEGKEGVGRAWQLTSASMRPGDESACRGRSGCEQPS